MLACAVGFCLVQALRRCGAHVPEWLVEVETQMRLFLVMMGAAQPREAVEEEAAVEKEAVVVEGSAEDPKLSQLKEGELQKQLEAVRADAAAAQGEAARAQQTIAEPHAKEGVWLDAFQSEFTKEESHRELKMAVGALANSAKAAVKSYLGDFRSLWGIVDDLNSIVLNMSWGSMETAERQAAIAWDPTQRRLAVLVLEGQSSSTDVGTFFGESFGGLMRTHTVKLKVKFKRMQAGDDVAAEICQRLMNGQMKNLVGEFGRTASLKGLLDSRRQ